MPEKIGKYLVRERIGRGGMGMIFKAHDPILDRPVALKVISTEVEVTDELRARFFREAQACARLSHPNIVTVYDMGEDEGRLYIVMELLEGEELRHLITQGKTPPLEDSLSIMMQVCDGLNYAHLKGIVHRDIKPANIFLQNTGQVKILDFGIAQMANTEGGLTRTGFIVGTLRYISPEQVRGRVDHRSDIYSAGAVFYELLSLRPPLTADDPMQLLEQLRTEDPTPLDRLDSSIPPELAAIIGQALRKDPVERFSNLEHMREALRDVQRKFLEEARRVGARVRDQCGQLVGLRAALAKRIGASGEDDAIPTVDDRARLAVVQAMERELAGRIAALQEKIARADALAPAWERAAELLRAEQFVDAIEELEAIVLEVPDHRLALEHLAFARAHVEGQRRERLAAKLMQDARAALASGEYTLTLEILKQATEIPPPAEAVAEIASLAEMAEAAAATRRARQQAETARGRMEAARRSAQAEADTGYAPVVWSEAEEKWGAAEAAFGQEAYAEAGLGFDAAAALYHRFREGAREAELREREAVQQAQAQVADGRQRSQEELAPQYARELWDIAETKSAEAQAALGERAMDRAGRLFAQALVLYGRAEEAARAARQRARQRAEDARAQVAQARERARVAGATHYAREPWDAVEGRSAEAEEAFAQRDFARAGQVFDEAAATYRSIEEIAREARGREQEAMERAREQMAQAQAAAQAEAPAQYAPALWDEAQAKLTVAEAARAREEYAEARTGFETAARAYLRCAETAREARRQARALAERAREPVEAGRERALAAAAPQYAPSGWDAAEAAAADAQAAFRAESLGRAADLFNEAAALYVRAAQDAAEARQRERRRAEEARARAAEARAAAATVDAQQQAPLLWGPATEKFAEAEGAFANERYAGAVEMFDESSIAFQEGERLGREARQRLRGQAEEGRRAMAERRLGAMAADAAAHAPSEWHDAATGSESGEAAFLREAYAEAREAFDQAAAQYLRAESRAREVARAIEMARAEAVKAREAAATARRTAADTQGPQYAAPQWRAAESAEAQASAALNRGEYQVARPLFIEARRQYGSAAQAASIAIEAESRRADAMVSDARRLLASGDVASCQRRLDEVLALRPGHAGAQQLRHEAEESQRHAENAERARIIEHDRGEAEKAREVCALARQGAAEAQASRYAPEQWGAGEHAEAQAIAALDRQDHTGASALFADAARLYAAATQAARIAQQAEAAERSRRDAGLGHRQVEAEATGSETVYRPLVTSAPAPMARSEGQVVPGRPGADETLTVLSPELADREIAAHAERPLEIAPAPEATSAPTAGDLGGSRVLPANARRRTLTVAIAGLAAIAVLGIGYWMHSPSASVWPPPDLQGLARQSVMAREEAVRAGAASSARFASGRESEQAAATAQDRREAATAAERYREAIARYKAATDGVEQARAAAHSAARRADDARTKAEAAEAPSRSAAMWTKAETARRAAVAQLDAGKFDRAEALFDEAERTYRMGEQTASDGRRTDERQEAETAQRDAEVARREAEQADARRLAGDAFGAAEQAEDEAGAALERDPAAARQGFLDASRRYRQAAQEAADRRVAGQREDVKRARERMMDARRAAEQSAAGQRAPVLLDWARKKEREASAAVERQELVLAEQLFGAAQAEYEIAAREGRRTRDRGPSEQLSAEQAQRRAATYRELAVKAGADRLPGDRDLFAIAQAKEAGADELMSRQSFPLAAEAYGDAGDRYLAAARRAGDHTEADVARDGMRAEKGRAGQRTAEYRDALAEETQGASAYGRRAYREAAERFRTAQGLYARAATKATAGSGPARPR